VGRIQPGRLLGGGLLAGGSGGFRGFGGARGGFAAAGPVGHTGEAAGTASARQPGTAEAGGEPPADTHAWAADAAEAPGADTPAQPGGTPAPARAPGRGPTPARAPAPGPAARAPGLGTATTARSVETVGGRATGAAEWWPAAAVPGRSVILSVGPSARLTPGATCYVRTPTRAARATTGPRNEPEHAFPERTRRR
jgi:hypothetical protein